MRIAILTTQCPFVIGGAELHAASLVRVLREAGHEAEIVSMPFKWYPSATILDHMLAARSMDVSEFNGVRIDLAICLKFPAYLMRHPNKTFWILHQHRQAYDMWDSGQTDLFNDADGQLVRDAIREADNIELGGATRIFANSANVAKRLRLYNNIVAEPLYHPPPLADRLHTGDYGSYFYYPSRISPSKRQEFVLRSLARSNANVRVVFSGAPDNADYGQSLRKLAQDLGVATRVEWRGFVSEAEMLELYAGARGVIFTPQDEDLGYIVFEAMLAGKPVITVSDAGEPAAIVRNNVEGCVVAPDHAEFADAMARLSSSAELARTMGMAGLERYHALGISWDKVIARLLDARAPKSAPHVALGEADSGKLPTDDAPARGATSGEDLQGEQGEGVSAISLAQFADRYVVGGEPSGDLAMCERSWARYCAALGALSAVRARPGRILEIGACEPYLFAGLLGDAFPDAALSVVQEGPPGHRPRYRMQSKQAGRSDISIDVFSLRIESAPLPFPDAEFDLVALVGVLERFAADPSFVLLETRRVLREGGILLIGTPNVVSLRSISEAINGTAPYESGEFRPWKGASGRHNREYTPHEVEALGRFAGMEPILLDTIDVAPQTDVADEIRDLVNSQGLPPRLRGQHIVYVGRKSASVVNAPYPSSLFAIDPRLFSGHLELERAVRVEDGFVIRILNKSPFAWPCRGAKRIRLTVDRIDSSGSRVRDFMAIDLPQDVAPGGFAELTIGAPTAGRSHYWYEIGLHVQGVGSFKDTGRSRTISLYASSLEPAWDHRLAEDAS